MPRRALLLASLCVCLAPVALAQTGRAVKGSKADMKGASTVFVDTKGVAELRDAIVQELARELPSLTVVDSADRAALVLVFQTGSRANPATSSKVSSPGPSSGSGTNPDYIPRPPGTTGPGTYRSPNPGDAVTPSEDASPPISSTMATGGNLGASAPDDPPFAFGDVLKSPGGGEILEWKSPIRTSDVNVARAFARKFADEYRKANGLPKK